MQQKGPRWAGEFMGRGYVVFSASTVDHPYEHLCGGRTIQEFTMDLFTRPDKVEAAMQAIMEAKREQTRQMIRAIGPFGYWVGSWRTAPQFLSPKLWDRFVWPYMKELVEIVAEEGGIPMLHYDACWDREIERLLELPARTCVLATDGATDLFRAKEILGGHMCLMGDVPPAMLDARHDRRRQGVLRPSADRGRPRRLHHGDGLRAAAQRQVRERQDDGGLGAGQVAPPGEPRTREGRPHGRPSRFLHFTGRPHAGAGRQYTPYSSTASRSAITFSGLASSVMELAPSTMSPPVSPKSSISPLT